MRYTDKDVTFYLVVYKDFDRASWCLQNLRREFPDARVVIDVDGDEQVHWRGFEFLNCEVNYGERLFLIEHGGAIVKRMLMHHATDPTNRRWLFRIDTDTEIRRRFKWLPVWDYFGHYYPWRNFVQGGCVGMTRNVCDRIIHSECLDREDLSNPRVWQENEDRGNGRVDNYGLVSFDWILNWAMCHNGVVGHDFGEIRSTWRDPIPKTTDCAVAHPCKEIPVGRPI